VCHFENRKVCGIDGTTGGLLWPSSPTSCSPTPSSWTKMIHR
jgi:hypothetical protein